MTFIRQVQIAKLMTSECERSHLLQSPDSVAGVFCVQKCECEPSCECAGSVFISC